jgi:hypothetical protein
MKKTEKDIQKLKTLWMEELILLKLPINIAKIGLKIQYNIH